MIQIIKMSLITWFLLLFFMTCCDKEIQEDFTRIWKIICTTEGKNGK